MSTQAIRNKEAFLREIGKELEQDNVAIFAGSGLSAPAGFVSWGELWSGYTISHLDDVIE